VGALALAMAVAACAPGETPDAAEAGAALPEGHPDISAMGAPGAVLAGVVRETVDGGGYTFARLDTGDREIWAAGPMTPLAVGDKVSLPDTLPMVDFTAGSLDRTFDVLYFTGAFQTGEVEMAATEFQGEVKETMNSAGYTYVQVAAGDQTLWLAAPETEVAVGATVAWNGGMRMVNFSSRTLNKTFDEIYFIGELVVLP
jgi:hypothetical protein